MVGYLTGNESVGQALDNSLQGFLLPSDGNSNSLTFRNTQADVAVATNMQVGAPDPKGLTGQFNFRMAAVQPVPMSAPAPTPAAAPAAPQIKEKPLFGL